MTMTMFTSDDPKMVTGLRTWNLLYKKHRLLPCTKLLKFDLVDTSDLDGLEKKKLDHRSIKIVPITRTYCIYIKQFIDIKVPHRILRGFVFDAKEKPRFEFRFNLSFFHKTTRKFFGRTFRSESHSNIPNPPAKELTYLNFPRVSFEETCVFFHTRIVDPNVVIVCEIICSLLDPLHPDEGVLRTMSVGFSLLDVFTQLNYGRKKRIMSYDQYFLLDPQSMRASFNQRILTSHSRTRINKGSPRSLLVLPLSGLNYYAGKTKAEFVLLRAEMMDKLTRPPHNLLQENDFYDENDAVPGLKFAQKTGVDGDEYDVPAFHKPVFIPTLPYSLNDLTIELPNQFEDSLIKQLEIIRKIKQGPLLVVEDKIVVEKRRMKMGVNNTCTFLKEMRDIDLRPVKRTSTVNNTVEVTKLIFEGTIEFREFLYHPECALVMELEYVVRIPQAMVVEKQGGGFLGIGKKKVIKKSQKVYIKQSISVGYYVFLPFYRSNLKDNQLNIKMIVGNPDRETRSFLGRILFVPPNNEDIVVKSTTIGISYDDEEGEYDDDDDDDDLMEEEEEGEFEEEEEEEEGEEEQPIIAPAESTPPPEFSMGEISIDGSYESYVVLETNEYESFTGRFRDALSECRMEVSRLTPFPADDPEVLRRISRQRMISKTFEIHIIAQSFLHHPDFFPKSVVFKFQLLDLSTFTNKLTIPMETRSALKTGNPFSFPPSISGNAPPSSVLTYDENKLSVTEIWKIRESILETKNLFIYVFITDEQNREYGRFNIPCHLFCSTLATGQVFVRKFRILRGPLKNEGCQASHVGWVSLALGSRETELGEFLSNPFSKSIMEYEMKSVTSLVQSLQSSTQANPLPVKDETAGTLSQSEEERIQLYLSNILKFKQARRQNMDEMMKKMGTCESKKLYVPIGQEVYFTTVITNLSDQMCSYKITFNHPHVSIPKYPKDDRFDNHKVSSQNMMDHVIRIPSMSNVKIGFRVFTTQMNLLDREETSSVFVRFIDSEEGSTATTTEEEGKLEKEIQVMMTYRSPILTPKTFVFHSKTLEFSRRLYYCKNVFSMLLKENGNDLFLLLSDEDSFVPTEKINNSFVLRSTEKKKILLGSTLNTFLFFYSDREFRRLVKIWNVEIHFDGR